MSSAAPQPNSNDGSSLVPLELTLPRGGGGCAEGSSVCAVDPSRCGTHSRCSISDVEQKYTFVTCMRNSVSATMEKVCQCVCHIPYLRYQEPAVRTGDASSSSGIVICGFLACTKLQQKSL